MIQFDVHIFQMGWFNHQLESNLPEFIKRDSVARRINPRSIGSRGSTGAAKAAKAAAKATFCYVIHRFGTFESNTCYLCVKNAPVFS